MQDRESPVVPEGARAGSAGALGRVLRDRFTWIVGAWTVVGLVWIRAYRWSAYFEIDESAYAAMALRVGGADDLDAVGRVLADEGTHGPLQALLAAPPQLIVRVDPRWLLVENVLLAAATAIVACMTARRLASRSAGTIAGTLTLLAPGVIEYSHLALTATPAMFFGMLAVYAMVRARGVEHVGWSVLTGVAIGAMTLGRSMTIGFVPALAAMALCWAATRRTSLVHVVRGALVVGVSAIATAAWWWVLRWDEVSDYLFGGGSSDTAQHSHRFDKLMTHVGELEQFIGTVVVAVALGSALALWPAAVDRSPRERACDAGFGAGAALLVLVLWDGSPSGPFLPVLLAALTAWALVRARRIAASAPNPLDDDRPLAVWPIWVGVGVGLAVLARSTAFGVGFVLPLVPWTVTAGVVSARRILTDRCWRWWWTAVVAVAFLTAVVVPGRGLDTNLTFCGADEPRAYCDIDSNAEGFAWRKVSDRIADRVLGIIDAVQPSGLATPVAMTGRDMTVNPNTVQLSMQWHDERFVDLWAFLHGGDVDDQLARVRDEAIAVVIVPDRYDGVILGADTPTPDQVVAAALDAGFYQCDEIPTPGGEPVIVMVSPVVPDTACRPGG